MDGDVKFYRKGLRHRPARRAVQPHVRWTELSHNGEPPGFRWNTMVFRVYEFETVRLTLSSRTPNAQSQRATQRRSAVDAPTPQPAWFST